jgi:hypothetical protein
MATYGARRRRITIMLLSLLVIVSCVWYVVSLTAPVYLPILKFSDSSYGLRSYSGFLEWATSDITNQNTQTVIFSVPWWVVWGILVFTIAAILTGSNRRHPQCRICKIEYPRGRIFIEALNKDIVCMNCIESLVNQCSIQSGDPSPGNAARDAMAEAANPFEAPVVLIPCVLCNHEAKDFVELEVNGKSYRCCKNCVKISKDLIENETKRRAGKG